MAKVNSLSLDLETFSSVDLSKCGVYKYAESPDFEILLFGYSVDNGEVRTIDLAQGEKIPQEIIDALVSDRSHQMGIQRELLNAYACQDTYVI